MIWLCLFVYVFVVLFCYGVLFVLCCFVCVVFLVVVYFSYVRLVFILLFLLYERTLLEPLACNGRRLRKSVDKLFAIYCYR